ncbi:transcriptional regulator [Pseudanabaena sp. UWO310]|uniref:transcriptional regulator n=1 Tax=Pseudanabaena sp. UWO310 TaxID=2480795 RepID=UPI001158481D|nr:transcriptional regulator [Pseudanabaena sp. UWO310]TYQ31985.1 transcriptional regulator [Pseudanabaena sp. UWO310]
MNSVQAQTNNAPVNTLVSDSYLDALINSLQDPIESACYLTAIIEAEEPEPELLSLALNDVSKALDQTGASTQSLEAILQKQGTEAIHSLADWLKGLGLKLTVTVDAAEVQLEDPDQDLEELEIAA